jgi:elongation factor Ts
VKKLRDKTGAGMMDCKKALNEADGDFAAAEKKLKEMGLAAAKKRMGRATNEGRVFTYIGSNASGILEFSCETDFVARNQDFVNLGNELIQQFVEEGTSPDDEAVQTKVRDAISTIKENMAIRRHEILDVAENEVVVDYIHGDSGHLGVLVKVSVDNPELRDSEPVRRFASDMALHVAAYNPSFLSQQTVPQKYQEEQESIFRKQAESLGKPEKVLENIIQGKMKKHYAEVCLLEQPFVKDDKKSVAQQAEAVGKELGATVQVSDYRYYRVGEELES